MYFFFQLATEQSFVVKFDFTSPDIPNDELQSWFSNNPGNIEQIFKIIKGSKYKVMQNIGMTIFYI